jgi:flagellar biosynthesis/type III secretory pathway protein FliH
MTRIIRAPRAPEAKPTRSLRPASTRVLRAGQLDGLREAEQALTRARSEARAIVDAARAEAESLRRRATEDGRTAAAAQLLAAERQARARLEQSREELTRLAVRVAEKILGEQLRVEPSAVTAIVAQCLRSCAASRRFVLRVNPDELGLIDAAAPRLRALVQAEVLIVEADPAVELGGCVIETELGEVDGQVATQLAAIEEALTR